jgi:Polyketide cyclase / dehydrase and lipid transport
MENLNFADSIVITLSPEDLYDMVTDVTRMGEWSPVCTTCWWDEGASPEVGAWFSGRNVAGDATWETRSQVVVADRGREFAYLVGGSLVRWGYTFEPVDGGTRLTESWEFLPDGIAMFEKHFGDKAQTHIEARTEAAHSGIPITLAAMKKSAEA